MIEKDYHGVTVRFSEEELRRLDDIKEGRITIRSTKITDNDIIYIFTSNDSLFEKARKLNISESHARNIKNGRRLKERVEHVWQTRAVEWLETLSETL
jgi:hypothetical protein